MGSSLAFFPKIKLSELLVCIPTSNRAHAFCAISEDWKQDSQSIRGSQRIPAIFAGFVGEVDNDWVVPHGLLEFRAGNPVIRQVPHVCRIPIKLLLRLARHD
jgi:hypothetical protein